MLGLIQILSTMVEPEIINDILIEVCNPISELWIPDGGKWTSMHTVAQLGMTDIARILAPYSKDVHVQDGFGMTPILWAFKEKYLNDINLVKTLAPMIAEKSCGDSKKPTEIQCVVTNPYLEQDKKLEFLKIIVPYSTNLNAPIVNRGLTPIEYAKEYEMFEIVKFFEALSENH